MRAAVGIQALVDHGPNVGCLVAGRPSRLSTRFTELGGIRRTGGPERRHALEVKGSSDENTMAVQELLADVPELKIR